MDLGQDVPFWSLILPWGVWSLCFVDNFFVLNAGLFSQLLWGWGRDAGSSLPTTGIKNNWPFTSQEISDYSQRYTERHRDVGLDIQWEDNFPFCPLVHKLKMSPCMLSHLLRNLSFLSCTNPPPNSTWSNTTFHMYQTPWTALYLSRVYPQQSSPKENMDLCLSVQPGTALTFTGTWKDLWGTNPHTRPMSQGRLSV